MKSSRLGVLAALAMVATTSPVVADGIFHIRRGRIDEPREMTASDISAIDKAERKRL